MATDGEVVARTSATIEAQGRVRTVPVTWVRVAGSDYLTLRFEPPVMLQPAVPYTVIMLDGVPT